MDIITTISAAKAAGFSGSSLITAVAIAGAESGFNPSIIGDSGITTSKWGPSVGLWQIRSLKNPTQYSYPDTLRDYNKLLDPYYNAKAAFAISKQGTDFGQWSTYVDGTFKSYLNKAADALKEAAPEIGGALILIIAIILLMK